MIEKIKRNESLIIFAMSNAWLFWILCVFWPGLFSNDGVGYISTFFSSNNSLAAISNESWLYGIIFHTLSRFLPHTLFYFIFQILFCSLILSFGHYVFLNYLKLPLAARVLSFISLILPLNFMMVIYTERDMLYHFSLLGLMFLLIKLRIKSSQNAEFYLYEQVSLTVFLFLITGLRREGLVFGPIVLVYLGWSRIARLKQLRNLCLQFFLICFFVLFLVPAFFGVYDRNYRVADSYVTMSFLKFNFLVIERKDNELTEENKKILSSVVDQENWNEVNRFDYIRPFLINKNVSESDHREFLKLTYTWVLRYPKLYLEHRWRMASGLLGDIFWLYDFDRKDYPLFDPSNISGLKLAPNSKFISVKHYLDLKLEWMKNDKYLSYIFSNILGAIAIYLGLLAITILFRLQFTFFICFLPFTQLAIAYLLSPLFVGKYVFIIYLSLPYLIVLAAREFKFRSPRLC